MQASKLHPRIKELLIAAVLYWPKKLDSEKLLERLDSLVTEAIEIQHSIDKENDPSSDFDFQD